MQSTLTCRAGDVARIGEFREMECLTWSNIEMTLSPTEPDNLPSGSNITLPFELRYMEGDKLSKIITLRD